MKLERNGKFFYWRWTWGYLRLTSFHDSTPIKIYYGRRWWSLWISRFNIDWDRTFNNDIYEGGGYGA